MKKFNGEKGQTLIFVALSMTVLLGFAALATDMGVVLHVKREAQTAADAAALAAATEELAEGNPATISEGVWNAAATDATANGFSATTVTSSPGGTSNCSTGATGATLCVNIASKITVPTFNTAGYVQATISQSAPTLLTKAFMGLFGNSSYSGMTVATTAIASDTIKSQGCFYVTDLSGDQPALDISTGNNKVITTSCGIYVNGNIDIGGSSSIDTCNSGGSSCGSVVATGTITGGSDITGPQASGAPPQTPPLAQLLLPAYKPSNINTTTGTCTPPPGSGFSTTQCYVNKQVTSTAGLYVFTQAPTFASNVSGSDIVIYLDGSVPYDDGNNVIGISGPSSGIYSGIVLDAPTDSPGSGFGCPKGNNKNNVAGVLLMNFGSSSSNYTGIVYAPYAHLFMQDQGAGTTQINTDLVIGTVCGQSGNVEVSGLTSDSVITKVGLVY